MNNLNVSAETIRNLLQQSSFHKSASTTHTSYEDDSYRQVRNEIENKSEVLLELIRPDMDFLSTLGTIYNAVIDVKEQLLPLTSGSRQILDAILESCELAADKYRNSDVHDPKVMLERTERSLQTAAQNPNPGAAAKNGDNDSFAATLIDQISEIANSPYISNDNDESRKYGINCLLITVSLVMMELGLIEAQRRDMANKSYQQAKQSFADFQKLMANFKSFFDGADKSSKDSGGKTPTTTAIDDFYAWLIKPGDGGKIDWSKAPIPEAILKNSDALNEFKNGMEIIINHYNFSDKDDKHFQNLLRSSYNNNRDAWLKDAVTKFMTGVYNNDPGAILDIQWSQEDNNGTVNKTKNVLKDIDAKKIIRAVTTSPPPPTDPILVWLKQLPGYPCKIEWDKVNWSTVPLPDAIKKDTAAFDQVKTMLTTILNHANLNAAWPNGAGFKNMIKHNYCNDTREPTPEDVTHWVSDSITQLLKGVYAGDMEMAKSIPWVAGTINGDDTIVLPMNKLIVPPSLDKAMAAVKNSSKPNLNLALPINYSDIPDSFKDIIQKGDGDTIYVTADSFKKAQQKLYTLIAGVASSYMYKEIALENQNAFDDPAHFSSLNNMLDTLLKLVATADEENNQRIVALNKKVSDIATLIKELIDKTKILT